MSRCGDAIMPPSDVSQDEEVFGLQVPMDDAFLVRCGEALCDLERVLHGLLLGDRTGVELPAQRLAFQKLHDGVGDAPLPPKSKIDRMFG